MHSVYLGIWAFINAAAGPPPPSSEAVVCSLTDFEAPSPAAQDPRIPGAPSSAGSPGWGEKAEKAEEPCFPGEHGTSFYGKHFLVLSPTA